MIYLSEKAGGKLVGTTPEDKAHTVQWLMWQMSGLGPNFGQLGHFTKYAKENVPYAIDRFRTECKRILKVLDKQLSSNQYMAGNFFSIADIATYPWIYTACEYYKSTDISEYPNIKRWYDAIKERPSVKKAYEVPY